MTEKVRLGLQAAQRREDLGLHRHVERRRRLVDEDPWARHERLRDPDSLHARRTAGPVAPEDLGGIGQADLEQFEYPFPGLAPGDLRARGSFPAGLGADSERRVEAGHQLWNAMAIWLPRMPGELAFGHGREVPAVQHDAAGADPAESGSGRAATAP